MPRDPPSCKLIPASHSHYLISLVNNVALVALDLNDNQIEKIENLQHLTNLKSLWILNFSTQHFYRNRVREILPRVKIIDAVPVNWVSGDPWQELVPDD
ncbi:hypothetical protein COOONC_20620 [Cooperia oncophora]